MTHRAEGQDYDPHGYLMLHRTTEPGDEGYGVGPFPTEKLANLYHELIQCECIKTLIPVALPPGVKLAMFGNDLLEFFVARDPKLSELVEALQEASKDDDDDASPLLKAIVRVVEKHDEARVKRGMPADAVEPVH